MKLIFYLYRGGSELSSTSRNSSPLSQGWQKIKSNVFIATFYKLLKYTII